LYEIAFLLALIPILYRVLNRIAIENRIVILSEAGTQRSEVPAQSKDPYLHHKPLPTRFLPGDAFKLFMVAYMSFRLLCDFLKPYPRIFLGLGGIQWACILILLYYSRDITRWLRPAARVANAHS
jgi:hypothetical protein